MSKKVVLFSTRDLEYGKDSKDYMFNLEYCKPDKVKTKEFCDYFIGECIPEEIVDYFNKKNWHAVKEQLKEMSLWKKTWEEEDLQKQYDHVCELNKDDVNSMLEKFETDIDGIAYKTSLELVNEIGKDYVFQDEKLNIGCDRQNENLPYLHLRFVLYEMSSNTDKYAVYGVWTLGQKGNCETWCDSLCSEILFRNPDCEEIILMLHDKDVKPKTVFDNVKYRELKSIVNPGNNRKHNFILTVSLFEHPNTPVGRLLKTPKLSSEKIFHIVSELINKPQLMKISTKLSEGQDVKEEARKFQSSEAIREIFLDEARFDAMSKTEINNMINSRICVIENII